MGEERQHPHRPQVVGGRVGGEPGEAAGRRLGERDAGRILDARCPSGRVRPSTRVASARSGVTRAAVRPGSAGSRAGRSRWRAPPRARPPPRRGRGPRSRPRQRDASSGGISDHRSVVSAGRRASDRRRLRAARPPAARRGSSTSARATRRCRRRGGAGWPADGRGPDRSRRRRAADRPPALLVEIACRGPAAPRRRSAGARWRRAGRRWPAPSRSSPPR